MSRHLTLRVSQAEFDFLDRLAREKNINRTTVARQLLLQNLALDAIKTEIAGVIESRFAAMEKRVEESRDAARENLIAATNFLRDEIKKQGVKK
jgi:hypothetical protein